jgi:hypothetical protein
MLMGTGLSLAIHDAAGRVIRQFGNQSEQFFRSEAGPQAGCLDPLLSLHEMVPQYFTKIIVFGKKLIGTTENITDDAMKPHTFTTLSDSYETTIQILEQRIPTPSTQQCMDGIREYAERMTLTVEIRDASTGADLFSRGGYRGRGGRGTGRQMHKCTHCKMDNHTTESCGKRHHADNDKKQ